MPVRLDPLDGSVALLGDGGESVHEADHSVAAVGLAGRLGADGVALHAWITADEEVVASRSGTTGLRRRRLASVRAAELDAPDLGAVLGALGTGWVALAVADERTALRSIEIATARGASDRLWLRAEDLDLLGRLRTAWPTGRLVSVARASQVPGGIERHVARLRDVGVDAVELRAIEWTSGHVSLCHRFRRQAWATDALHEPVIEELLTMGADALLGRNVERLVDVAARAGAPRR